jgi:hypothetical protein
VKPNRNDVLTALRQHGVLQSQAAANRLLQEVGGVDALADLPESKFAAVIAACGVTGGANGRPAAKTINEAGIWNHWNRPGQKAPSRDHGGDHGDT